MNPDMLILARESRGITQNELAVKLEVSQGWLSRVEGGLRNIPEDAEKNIAETLGYPVNFFRQNASIYGFGVSEIFHRKRLTLSNRLLNKIHALINIRAIELSKLLKGVEIGAINIKPIELDDYDNSPSEVARLVRASWRLPRGPVTNIVLATENAGAIIFPIDFETSNIDAIGHCIVGLPPLFFVNSFVPTDRLRFTLMHEMGHVIMHRNSFEAESMERQADEFAAEFLMPDKEIRPQLRDLSLEKLMVLKQYWKVSMAALLKRASDLEQITPRQAKYLWMQMAKAGYRKREPSGLDLPEEQPQLCRKIVDTYFKDMEYTIEEFSQLLSLKEEEVSQIYLNPEKMRQVREYRSAINEVENIFKQSNN